MYNIQQLHDSGSVVADGRLAPPVHDQLVHASWTQGSPAAQTRTMNLFYSYFIFSSSKSWDFFPTQGANSEEYIPLPAAMKQTINKN